MYNLKIGVIIESEDGMSVDDVQHLIDEAGIKGRAVSVEVAQSEDTEEG